MLDFILSESNFLPERRKEFTPERREKERWLVKESQKAIKNLKNISKEEKIKEIKAWDEYLHVYMHEYQRYHRVQLEKLIYQATVTVLN